MKREEAVLLLKELIATCASFCTAQAVSLEQEKGQWILTAVWVPAQVENEPLNIIVANNNLQMIIKEDRMVFRTRKE